MSKKAVRSTEKYRYRKFQREKDATVIFDCGTNGVGEKSVEEGLARRTAVLQFLNGLPPGKLVAITEVEGQGSGGITCVYYAESF